MIKGYTQIHWPSVSKGDRIYILDPNGNSGAGKAFGPYEVIDPAKQTVIDPKLPHNGEWAVMEPIGVPDTQNTGGPLTGNPNQAVSLTPSGNSPNTRQAMEAMRNWIVVDIASKASNLDPATRSRLEADAVTKSDIAERTLNDWKRGG